jgi:hypothetical protein
MLWSVTETLTQCLHWDAKLAGFLLATRGGERSGPNMMLWILFSFMLGSCGGWGEIFRRLNLSETATHVMGRYVTNNAKWALFPLKYNHAFGIYFEGN